MLQYSPDQLQWFLLTASSTVGRGLFILGIILFIWIILAMLFPQVPGFGKRSAQKFSTEDSLRADRRKQNQSNSMLWPGLTALVLLGLSIIPFQFAEPKTLETSIANELAETAKFSEVKLLQIDTVSQSPIAESAIVYIGTATDVDGDPRQFRYTQYEKFGVYESIGFEKPAVDLKDDTFQSTEKGLEIYKGTAEPEDESTETPSETPAP